MPLHQRAEVGRPSQLRQASHRSYQLVSCSALTTTHRFLGVENCGCFALHQVVTVVAISRRNTYLADLVGQARRKDSRSAVIKMETVAKVVARKFSWR